MIKISIITICFNSDKTIEKTIKSVLTQSYKNIEYIVIDGKSSDNTVSIISKYKKKINYFVSESDQGIYDAFNKGIAKATGDIIGILNSDDFFADKNTLSFVARHMKNSQIDMLFGDVIYVNKHNKIIRYYDSSCFTKNKIPYGFMPAHPSIFLRKFLYEQLGGFSREYKIAGDFEFFARAFANYNINYKYYKKIMVKMGIGGTSTQPLNILTINREILKACRSNGYKTNYFKLSSRYFLKFKELFLSNFLTNDKY